MSTTQERLTKHQVNRLRQMNQAIAQANRELAQILAQNINFHLEEIRKAEAELETLDPGLFADNRHVFTLIFTHGEMALVEVHGAPTQYQARTTMRRLFKHYDATVLDGSQADGRVVGDFRCWYSSAAQEFRQVETKEEGK